MAESTKIVTPRHRLVLYEFTNWILFVAGIVNLGVGTWFAAQGDAAIAATSLTAGLVLLFAATIDRFESLKGLGIEAKTRKLNEKIEQADEALHRLRQLAELTSIELVDINSKMGRWDSAPSPRESLALVERVRSTLQALGSEPTAIATALQPWALTLFRDLVRAFTVPLCKLITDKMGELQIGRHAVPTRSDPNDPEVNRLTEEIKLGQAYIDGPLNKIYQLDLDNYPQCFLDLFENVPYLAQEELLQFREKAARFAKDMTALKQSNTLPNAETWMHELEGARRHKE